MAKTPKQPVPPAGKHVVAVVHADTEWGVHATRAFAKHSEFTAHALVSDANSSWAGRLKDTGATVHAVDTMDADAIGAALDAAKCMTVVLVPSSLPNLVLRCNNALTAAAGRATNVILWSSVGVDHAADLPTPDEDNAEGPALTLLAEVEELVKHKDERLRAAIVRIGFPLQAFFHLQRVIQNRGMVPFPTDKTRFAPIDMGDVAFATVGLICANPTKTTIADDYTVEKRPFTLLTGPEKMSGPMLVTAANEGLGARLAFANVSLAEMRSFLAQTDLPPFELALHMARWRLFNDGTLDKVSVDDLRDLMAAAGGKDVTSAAGFFHDHRAEFSPRAEAVAAIIESEQDQPEESSGAQKKEDEPVAATEASKSWRLCIVM